MIGLGAAHGVTRAGGKGTARREGAAGFAASDVRLKRSERKVEAARRRPTCGISPLIAIRWLTFSMTANATCRKWDSDTAVIQQAMFITPAQPDTAWLVEPSPHGV